MERLQDHSLVKALLDGKNNFLEVLHNYRIKLAYAVIDGASAVVYYSKRGYYNILINSSLSFEMQQRTFLHELKHIIEDMPKCTYTVCFDENTDEIYRMEHEADRFVDEMEAIYKPK